MRSFGSQAEGVGVVNQTGQRTLMVVGPSPTDRAPLLSGALSIIQRNQIGRILGEIELAYHRGYQAGLRVARTSPTQNPEEAAR